MSSSMLDRSVVKTREQRFVQSLMGDFGIAPRIAREVLAIAQEVLLGDGGSAQATIRPGQIRKILAATDAPHGRPLAQSQMVEVLWTVNAPEEDAEVRRKFGRKVRRQVRIMRLAGEAVEQGGLATEEDLAEALHVDTRTIRRDIGELERRGELVPTRGKVKGVGCGQTHKAKIVALYLHGHTYEEIHRRSRHAISCIKRYVLSFGRVALLYRTEKSLPVLASTIGISERLAREYVALIEGCREPIEQDTLADLVARLGGEHTPVSGEKGGCA